MTLHCGSPTLVFGAVALTLLGAGGQGTERPPAEPGRDSRGARGAVTAGHPLAAEAGLRVLQQGGNAMDAAITMAAMLAVARPHMNGVGGDMFLLYYEAASGQVYGLNASGLSGSAKTLEELRADGLRRLPSRGPISVSVPGAVGGWAEALQRFGTLSWRAALDPAVRLARGGLPVSERLAEDIGEQVERLRVEPEAASIFLPGNSPPRPGTVLEMQDFAGTLERIQGNGPGEMYRGETARQVAAYLHERGGLVTADDLASYQSVWVEPISTEYDGLDVLALPPNTQGVTLLEAIGLLRHFDLRALGHNSTDYLHIIAETIRLASEDRDRHVADPVAMTTSVGTLLDADRLAELAKGIDPGGVAPAMEPSGGEPDQPNTVYVIAVDEAGNVVSLIQSLYASFGSGLVVPGTGVVLHNRGSLFRFDEDHPNVFAPGRRPYHTLCPALVLRDGRPSLAFGTPGGYGQTHTLVQVLNNITLFGMTPQEAIDAPRIRWYSGGRLSVEDRISPDVRDRLASRGYEVQPRTGWTAEFGGAQAVLIDPATNEKRAGADRRREGWALAY